MGWQFEEGIYIFPLFFNNLSLCCTILFLASVKAQQQVKHKLLANQVLL